MLYQFLLVSVIFGDVTWSLDNGLARTPPMGWMHWERFRCITDCKQFPDECISERLFKRTTDLLVDEGYLDAGYEFVIIDDCWLEKYRDNVTKKLVEDRSRFPSGLKHLADYIHGKGAKFGLYQDYGTHTCAGYPGVIDNMALDAQTFADWDVDYVKLDGCYADINEMDRGYPEFGKLLNRTGRPMVYSCSWPVYQEYEGKLPNYEALKENCNLWRNWDDIDDSFESLAQIMDYFSKNQDRIQPHAAPGHWNDPDMLILGNYGLSYDQSKLQMAVWSILAAPLIMSNDLATIRPEIKDILQNKRMFVSIGKISNFKYFAFVAFSTLCYMLYLGLPKYVIAVDQDRLGIQGRRLLLKNKIEVWSRPITPVITNNQHSYAVAFVSRRADGAPYSIKFKLSDLNLTNKFGYSVTDLYNNNKHVGTYKPGQVFSTRINPNGVTFYKFTVLN